jgi:hypothetical protein
MKQERRKRTRVPLHIDVSVLLQGEVVQLQTLNISLTGILCTSNGRFQKDVPCNVIIRLNKDLQISIDSKVLRVGKDETAISFTSMDEESFSHLKKLMQYNMGNADRIDEELRYPAFE